MLKSGRSLADRRGGHAASPPFILALLITDHQWSVGVPIGVGAIAKAYACTGKDLRGHEARVDAHPVALAVYGSPVRDTAAVPTAVEFDGPAVPHVDVGGRIGGQHAHLMR